MKEKVLSILESSFDSYVSGEDISGWLNISRTAVWKHINSLRRDGYEIASQPKRGYRLVSAPDFLYQQEITNGLNTEFIGRKVYHFHEAASTNSKAKELAEKGAEEGVVVAAEKQTEGKGRLGRKWISPVGGIWLSIILRPPVQPYKAGVITLMTAVCAAKSVKNTTGIDLEIKWPNDLLYGGKKVCGILTEMKAEMDRIEYMVQGIGLNANLSSASLGEFSSTASSLQLILGRKVDRVSLVRELLDCFENYYNLLLDKGTGLLCDLWKKNNCTLGRYITVYHNKEKFSGTASDITSEGGLVVRSTSGNEKVFYSGEVTIEK